MEQVRALLATYENVEALMAIVLIAVALVFVVVVVLALAVGSKSASPGGAGVGPSRSEAKAFEREVIMAKVAVKASGTMDPARREEICSIAEREIYALAAPLVAAGHGGYVAGVFQSHALGPNEPMSSAWSAVLSQVNAYLHAATGTAPPVAPGAIAPAPPGMAGGTIHPTTGFSGRPLTEPEVVGATSRRTRLLGECVRRVAPHPMAQPTAMSWPIGDGAGLEEIAGIVRGVFAMDHSLARWVALRGALAFLHAQYIEGGGAGGRMDLCRVMGIDLSTGHDGGLVAQPYVFPDQPPRDPQVTQDILGLFFVVRGRLDEYPRYEDLAIDDAAVDPSFASVSMAIATEIIAWTAVAALRDGVAANLMAVPEPARFEGPGWYAEPIFAKAERYWDGDWSPRCRRTGSTDEILLPLA